MIVSCPGCSTHYQHQIESHLHTGRCSRCDETFSLENSRPGYVVRDVERLAQTPDPLLAAGMESSQQLDRPPLERSTPDLEIAADELAPADMPLDEVQNDVDELTLQNDEFPEMEPFEAADTQNLGDTLDTVESLEPLESADDEEDSSFFGSGIDDDEALFGIEEGATAEAVAAESEDQELAAAAEGSSRPSHPVRETIGVFLLSGLGGAAGFQGSLQFGFEPLNAIGVGLGAGLTLGWAWIRWAERRR